MFLLAAPLGPDSRGKASDPRMPTDPAQALLPSKRIAVRNHFMRCANAHAGRAIPTPRRDDMADHIRDVMTQNPQTLPASATVREAAETMRANDIGDVIAIDDRGGILGIVTDRDIAVRVVAEGRDPRATRIEDIASRELTVVSPDDPVERAVELIRERAVRRLPVVKRGKTVGIVSIGDLAIERDSGSALADISAAPPNT
jgi:CBS domain-containing protein